MTSFVSVEHLAAGSLFLAVIALSFSVSSFYSIRRRHRHRTLERRLTDCETEALELRDKIDATFTYAKKKYARDAVREHRKGKQNGIPDPHTDPEGWKREMMKKHVLGGKT